MNSDGVGWVMAPSDHLPDTVAKEPWWDSIASAICVTSAMFGVITIAVG